MYIIVVMYFLRKPLKLSQTTTTSVELESVALVVRRSDLDKAQ